MLEYFVVFIDLNTNNIHNDLLTHHTIQNSIDIEVLERRLSNKWFGDGRDVRIVNIVCKKYLK